MEKTQNSKKCIYYGAANKINRKISKISNFSQIEGQSTAKAKKSIFFAFLRFWSGFRKKCSKNSFYKGEICSISAWPIRITSISIDLASDFMRFDENSQPLMSPHENHKIDKNHTKTGKIGSYAKMCKSVKIAKTRVNTANLALICSNLRYIRVYLHKYQVKIAFHIFSQ